MKHSRLAYGFLLVGAATGLIGGCSSGTTTCADRCVPGRSVGCIGPNGCKGFQECYPGGYQYSPCVCEGAEVPPPPTSGTGGDGSGAAGAPATACPPEDQTGFAGPPYTPAKAAQQVCTVELVDRYHHSCTTGENPEICNAEFQAGGAYEACGACLTPTLRNEPQYGPLLRLEDSAGWFFALETNTAGCVELKGDLDCAARIQDRERCLVSACIDVCPPVDSASYALYRECKQLAAAGTCADLVAAAECFDSSPGAEYCTGASFDELAKALGYVFCAGG